MKRAIILIFAMFLIIIPISFAQTINYTLSERYNDNSSGTEFRPCRIDLWTAQTFTVGNTGANKNYNVSKIGLWFANEGSPSSMDICLYSTSGGSPSSPLSCNYTVAEDLPMTTIDDKFENFNVSIPTYEIAAGGVYAIVCNGSDSGAPNQFGIFADASSPTYEGGSMYQGVPPTTQISSKDIIFEVWGIINTTITSDTTPPVITYYNLTSSDNGCENWNTDKNNPCSTSSVTPTVQFNTNESAFCAIGGSSNSTSLDSNYTGMTSSRNCTGAASGEGATSHLCTLTGQDELVYETSYLFISCKDFNNNENRTSTSGALAINITGIEATAKTSMELGIENSLSSGYSIYTNQRIYARNSANNQSTGLFDKIVKKLSKIWVLIALEALKVMSTCST